MGSVRRILCTRWVTDFLQYLLDHDSDSTLLIVCATRESFLEQLFATVHAQSLESPSRHRLLTKTIGALSKSTRVHTVFCPTLEHLRAYLSGGINRRASAVEEQQTPLPLMAILDPLSVHLSTLEFSAQGLSRTLAIAVELSSTENVDLVLCECQNPMNRSSGEHGEALWYVEVPLLSQVGTNRSILVRRVVQRWFEFTELNTRTYTVEIENQV